MIVHPIHENLLLFETLNDKESLFTFTTTVRGGVSKGNYQSFNLGLFSGDDEANVLENRRRLIEEIATSQLYLPYQTHKDKIALIDEAFLSKTDEEKQHLLYGVDALVTDRKNICIGVGTADCVPIIMYDPQFKVLAVVHAGWRGTVARLPQKVVAYMSEIYGCDPQTLLVGMGPSVSQRFFEVGDEVIVGFRDANFEIEKIAKENPITHKYHIDLWAANQLALIQAGIPKQQIEISGLCTYADPDRFFSARRQTVYSGRIVTGGILL